MKFGSFLASTLLSGFLIVAIEGIVAFVFGRAMDWGFAGRSALVGSPLLAFWALKN